MVGLSVRVRSQNPNLILSYEQITHYLRGILTTANKEIDYIETHKLRFYETLRLVSLVIPQLGAKIKILDVGSHPKTIPALIKKYLGCDDISCCNLEGGVVKVINPKYGDEFQFNVDKCDVERETLPYPSTFFDVVLCCETLEHLTCDPMFMLTEINRVLKWGALLLLTTPNLASARSVKATLEGEHPHLIAQYVAGSINRHNREYTPKEVKRLLECGGFQIVSLMTKDVFREPCPDVIKLLNELGKDTDMRGDDILALARKTSPVLERYPDEFYQK